MSKKSNNVSRNYYHHRKMNEVAEDASKKGCTREQEDVKDYMALIKKESKPRYNDPQYWSVVKRRVSKGYDTWRMTLYSNEVLALLEDGFTVTGPLVADGKLDEELAKKNAKQRQSYTVSCRNAKTGTKAWRMYLACINERRAYADKVVTKNKRKAKAMRKRLYNEIVIALSEEEEAEDFFAEGKANE